MPGGDVSCSDLLCCHAGDAVLGLVVSQLVFDAFPTGSTEVLNNMRCQRVSAPLQTCLNRSIASPAPELSS